MFVHITLTCNEKEKHIYLFKKYRFINVMQSISSGFIHSFWIFYNLLTCNGQNGTPATDAVSPPGLV